MEYHIKHQQQVLEILKDNLSLAHNQMKQEVDKHCNQRSFDMSDCEFL